MQNYLFNGVVKPSTMSLNDDIDDEKELWIHFNNTHFENVNDASFAFYHVYNMLRNRSDAVDNTVFSLSGEIDVFVLAYIMGRNNERIDVINGTTVKINLNAMTFDTSKGSITDVEHVGDLERFKCEAKILWFFDMIRKSMDIVIRDMNARGELDKNEIKRRDEFMKLHDAMMSVVESVTDGKTAYINHETLMILLSLRKNFIKEKVDFFLLEHEILRR